MAWSDEASVVSRGGRDYWRTWFLEECEKHGMFGLTEKHLSLATADGQGFQSYREGTEICLEDAPYFRKTKTYHRVCGPYNVIPSILPIQAEAVHKINGKIIIYKEKSPSNGPWLDRSYVRRIVDGVELKYKQLASEFGFFPYRFSIKKASKYKVHLVRHESECWLCVR
ncbi:MAG: hypothetical protein MUO63_04575 [Desulfobulbaceae bacterium]|nr:hypothetical protein [Desulfobulbaceae bacterium]